MNNITTRCNVGEMSLYRLGKQSECSGSLHRLTFIWEVRGGHDIQGEDPEKTIVCDGHMSGFMLLGAREGYRFRILLDNNVEASVLGEKEQ